LSMNPEPHENANKECVGPNSDLAGKASSCAGCPNQAACASGQAKQRDPALDEIAQRLSPIKHKILVLSGKGGVGKSTFASQFAWFLAGQNNNQVGILDIDICGPSIPRMMGVENAEVRQSSFGWEPVYADDNLAVMSIGFMLGSKDDAVIWRGPRKNGLIKQFLTDVAWGNLDFLIVDAPPGTSDEHISIAQYLKEQNIDGAIVVTTPQEIALLDVRKEINFCRKTGIPVLGVVENMAGYVCPCCKARTEIFSADTGGAAKMAADMGIKFFGSIPLDPLLLRSCERGESYFASHPDAPATKPFSSVVEGIMQSLPANTVH